jgi:hypothetical protein
MAAGKHLELVLEPGIVKRGFKYSLVVGTVLVLINHGDSILAADVSQTQVWKILLTYMVPYVVSSLSSVQALLASED